MGSDLIQDNDCQIQLKRKESDNHIMLCTHQERKEEFYGQLQTTMDNIPVGGIKILTGDMNTKLG